MKPRKIGGILVLLLFLISISGVFAIESSLKKEYQTGETLIASFAGFSEIKLENILFYSGRAYQPLAYDLAKIDGKYYLYAQLPFEEKNLTLKLLKAKFFEQGQEVSRDLDYDFLVNGNISAFSVNPGFIITNSEFKINIQNFDKPTTITTNFLENTNTYSLDIGEEKTLTFEITNTSSEILTISGGDAKYEIPIAIFTDQPVVDTTKHMRFSKSELNLTVLKDKLFQYEIYLVNNGEDDLTNIELSSNYSDLVLTPSIIDLLRSGEIQIINITLTPDKSSIISVFASSENITAESIIYINAISNEQEYKEAIKNTSQVNYQSTSPTCASLNGKICAADEKCTTASQLTLDGYCCTGVCNIEDSGTSWWLIIIIIIILLGIGFFVFKRLQVRSQTSREILKLKNNEYEQRFKPQETRGGLTKI